MGAGVREPFGHSCLAWVLGSVVGDYGWKEGDILGAGKEDRRTEEEGEGEGGVE